MELYNGDCLEVMKSIPDDSVDMVLTDLPYGTTRNAWDSIIPFEPLWAQLKRVTKRGGAIALHADMPFAAKLVCSNLPWYRYELIWEKPLGSDFLNANRKPLKIMRASRYSVNARRRLTIHNSRLVRRM